MVSRRLSWHTNHDFMRPPSVFIAGGGGLQYIDHFPTFRHPKKHNVPPAMVRHVSGLFTLLLCVLFQSWILLVSGLFQRGSSMLTFQNGVALLARERPEGA